jgi:hypothetical protein
VSTEDPTEAPIPVLRDVVTATGPAADVAAGLGRLHDLSPDARAALGAEARYILDALLDEYQPLLEAELRVRLERRLRDMLGE